MDGAKRFEIRGSLLARSTLLNFIGQVVPFLVGVVTIPFIIQGLGTERFGLLSLAWVVLGYFVIFDLGLGRATTKFVAEALGKGEEEEIPRLVWTAVTVQAILGLLGALVLVGITPLLVERILNIPSELIGEAKTTFYLLSLSVPIVLISSSFRGVLEAFQRFDLVNAVKIPSSALTFLLPLVGLWLGFSLPGIVALILLARVGALTAFVVLNLRLVLKLKRYSGSISLFPRLFSFGGWVMLSNILAPFLRYLDRFMIGALLSMSAVAYYSAPFDIMERLWIIPSSLVLTLFPAFSTLGGLGHHEETQKLFLRSTKYLIILMSPLIFILMVFDEPILQFWLGRDFAQLSTTVFQILIIIFFLDTFAYIPFTAIQGLGRPDLKAKLDLIQLPIFVAFCWWLIPKSGLVGAALAKLTVTLIDTSCLFWMAKDISGLLISELFSARLGRAIIISGTFSLAVFTLKVVSRLSFFNILILTGFVTAYIFLFLKATMDEKDWSTFHSVLNSFLRKETIT